jgi:hypothetical protein
MSEDLSREEVQQVIDRLVDELLDAAGVIAPPVDAVALARDFLHLPDLDRPRRGQGRRADPEHEATEEQRQWAAAQAIGASCKHTTLERLDVPPDQARALGGVSLANLFASHLLAPAAWFAPDARELDYDLEGLRGRYRTAPWEVLARRLLDLPEPCVITLVDGGAVQRRRSNAWPVSRDLVPAERECQRYVHHYSRPRVVRAGGWTVQGWPVHSSDRKREVLRSVCDGDVAAE